MAISDEYIFAGTQRNNILVRPFRRGPGSKQNPRGPQEASMSMRYFGCLVALVFAGVALATARKTKTHIKRRGTLTSPVSGKDSRA